LKITEIKKGSQADREDIRPGDELLAVNGQSIRDDIDLMYYSSEDMVILSVIRDGVNYEKELDGLEDLGIELEEMRFKSCGNNCIFCFVDQNPPGMRKAVYFKDEDYRLSFLHGSYITLTTLSESEIDRILEQRLSPLYVSVHATELSVRKKILGIRHDDRFMEKIDRLIEGGIRLHCQIVVCPGINDGIILEKTINDLAGKIPGVLSLAVVPVGMTCHREGLYPLKPVDSQAAREIIRLVDRFRSELIHKSSSIINPPKEHRTADFGTGFVYCADELYNRAGIDIPSAGYYDDFPQIENGVGMIRDFLDASGRLESTIGELRYTGKVAIVTGFSMEPYLHRFAERLMDFTSNLEARVIAVPNHFFGESVTVSGLLAGRDIIAALQGIDPDETVLLPPNCLNAEGLFLDDLSLEDIARSLNVTVYQGEYDPVATFFEEVS
jgi:putative radical SAM enzyme (TIGR03279 family)